jgi:glycerol-1-phosphate dehydrogenase [NAD(P)+]
MSVDLAAELAAVREVAGLRGDARIGLESILLGPSALDSLVTQVERLATSDCIVMLEDATSMRRGRQELKTLVAHALAAAGAVQRVVLGPDDGALLADAATIAAAAAAAEQAGCIVTVGSGTLTDVGKEAARLSGAPLVAVQTAASVNGYADGLAVILRDGVKRTVPSAWPSVLIIDTQVLADAPPELTRSGFAEMMAMFTAPADWRLAGALGHDGHFDQAVVDLFRFRGDGLLSSATALRTGDKDAVGLLAALLTTSGMAMGAAGGTAPMSGMEHLISHLLDMSAHAGNGGVGLHGAQVGVASLVAACLWERLLTRLEPSDIERDGPGPAELRRAVEAAFVQLDPTGAMAAECWSDCERKLATWRAGRAHRTSVAARWPQLRTELATFVGEPVAIASALAEAGAPTRFGQLDPPVDASRARWAVSSCHLMRDRFTVADFAFLTGHWTADDVDAVLTRAAELGGGL